MQITRTHLNLIAVSLISLTLSACSSFSTQSKTSVKSNSQPGNLMGNWGVSGKIGVTTPTESVAGFIEWQQQDHNFDVYVSGPMSVGNTRIKGNPDKISITQQGKTTSGLNPQKLIYDQLGWFFPVQNLPFWLKGQAAPYSKANVSTASDGKISGLKQDNWHVAYPRYNSYYEQPSRIVITQGQWKFLIVIKNWTFS